MIVIVWFQELSITHAKGGIGNWKGRGVMKAKLFKGRYESKLEFPLGFRRGVQARNSSVRGK